MNKYLKKFIIFLVVAIILQGSILLIINYKFLKGFSAENRVTSVKEPQEIKKNLIDEKAVNIKSSNNGEYIAYMKENKLNYLILNNFKKDSIDNISPIYYKWLYNDDLLLVENNKEDGNKFIFYSYNIKNRDKRLIANLVVEDKQAEIEDIQNSSLKNLIFVKIKSANNNEIYKLNIQNEFEKVKLVSDTIRDMAVIPHEDKLIYNTENYNRFYVTYVGTNFSIPEKGKLTLLGIDKSDRVFVAIEQGGEIKKIYYGLITENIDSWSKIQIKENIKLNQVYLSDSGNVFVFNDNEGKIKSLVGDKEFNYQGKLLKVMEDRVISIKNGEVIINYNNKQGV